MKKQLFLTALMSVTAFSAQASTLDLTDVYRAEVHEAIRNAAIKNLAVKEFNAGFHAGFCSGVKIAYRRVSRDLRCAAGLAAVGIVTYYAIKFAKSYIEKYKNLQTTVDHGAIKETIV